jgi:predicted metal-dependent phosphoesterase TrpH
MPAGQPFTQLCLQLSRPRHHGRVDLHLHTQASDGTYTPAQVIDLAQRSGLSALAITDHDTCAGIAAARHAAAATLEVATGVEITAEFRGRELHLLGYFFALTYEPLQQALARLRVERVGRFHEMVGRLAALGVRLPEEALQPQHEQGTLGRRNLAEMLVKAGRAATVREAFQRWLGDHARAAVPKVRLAVADAIALVRGGGGVAAWAHPSYDCTSESLAALRDHGMQAVEVEFPSCRPSRSKELRQLAAAHGLAVTGGSDCHGPGQPRQAVGGCSIAREEYVRLKELSGERGALAP